jgi:hypothetical protein
MHTPFRKKTRHAHTLRTLRGGVSVCRYGGMHPQTDILQMDPALSYGLVEYLRTIEMLVSDEWACAVMTIYRHPFLYKCGVAYREGRVACVYHGKRLRAGVQRMVAHALRPARRSPVCAAHRRRAGERASVPCDLPVRYTLCIDNDIRV